MKIKSESIVENNSCFIVAELSANHNGRLDVAIETIKAAKKTGADAIKLQTYTPDTMTLDTKTHDFLLNKGTIWDGQYLYDLYKQAYTPWEWHKKLFQIAAKEGLICFSTPFDKTAVDFLESLNNPIYKIASFEITHIPLIEYAASKGKPMIISTGIATEEDIKLALETCYKVGNKNITLLKCVSSYPAPMEEANLAIIPDLTRKFNVKSGLSDHTLGIVAPVVAVSLGAKVIEKHFILDKSIGGPDASFSLDKKEFKMMVNAVRQAEKAIGSVDYTPTKKMIEGRYFSRSIYVAEDMKKGDIFNEKNLQIVRPGFGLHPKYYLEMLGKKVSCGVKKGTALKQEYVNS